MEWWQSQCRLQCMRHRALVSHGTAAARRLRQKILILNHTVQPFTRTDAPHAADSLQHLLAFKAEENRPGREIPQESRRAAQGNRNQPHPAVVNQGGENRVSPGTAHAHDNQHVEGTARIHDHEHKHHGLCDGYDMGSHVEDKGQKAGKWKKNESDKAAH